MLILDNNLYYWTTICIDKFWCRKRAPLCSIRVTVRHWYILAIPLKTMFQSYKKSINARRRILTEIKSQSEISKNLNLIRHSYMMHWQRRSVSVNTCFELQFRGLGLRLNTCYCYSTAFCLIRFAFLLFEWYRHIVAFYIVVNAIYYCLLVQFQSKHLIAALASLNKFCDAHWHRQ